MSSTRRGCKIRNWYAKGKRRATRAYATGRGTALKAVLQVGAGHLDVLAVGACVRIVHPRDAAHSTHCAASHRISHSRSHMMLEAGCQVLIRPKRRRWWFNRMLPLFPLLPPPEHRVGRRDRQGSSGLREQNNLHPQSKPHAPSNQQHRRNWYRTAASLRPVQWYTATAM